MLDEIYKAINSHAFANHKEPYENFTRWTIVKREKHIEIFLDEITEIDFKFFKKITKRFDLRFFAENDIINNDDDCIRIDLRCDYE